MSKFKIGDKVKILSTSAVDGLSNHGVKVGMIGECFLCPFKGVRRSELFGMWRKSVQRCEDRDFGPLLMFLRMFEKYYKEKDKKDERNIRSKICCSCGICA